MKPEKKLQIRNSTAEFLIFTRQAGEDCPRLRPRKSLGVLFVILKVGADVVLGALPDTLPFHGRP